MKKLTLKHVVLLYAFIVIGCGVAPQDENAQYLDEVYDVQFTIVDTKDVDSKTDEEFSDEDANSEKKKPLDHSGDGLMVIHSGDGLKLVYKHIETTKSEHSGGGGTIVFHSGDGLKKQAFEKSVSVKDVLEHSGGGGTIVFHSGGGGTLVYKHIETTKSEHSGGGGTIVFHSGDGLKKQAFEKSVSVNDVLEHAESIKDLKLMEFKARVESKVDAVIIYDDLGERSIDFKQYDDVIYAKFKASNVKKILIISGEKEFALEM